MKNFSDVLMIITAITGCHAFHQPNNNNNNNNKLPLLHKSASNTKILTDDDNGVNTDRRSFVRNALTSTAIISSAAAMFATEKANAIDDEEEVFYFGCGCFWHVQHEFVEAERKLLGRKDNEITSRAGYAGGKGADGDKNNNGRVCYHNAAMIGDYGKFGHAEIVSVSVPKSRYGEFATEYCKLFTKGLRPDQSGDRGLEYRNVVGIPGGASGKYKDLATQLIEASKATGDQLDFAIGKGSDRDVPQVVWIMDSTLYPPYKAEQYHQFHDGFNFNENYPNTYNNLVKQNFSNEDFGKCPNGGLGLGIGGL
mmetsp:Transcript_15853/g.18297  ORF Transcript_15853/g.18297 Transcript_15853/m.18297 type:complete len:310 (-) Transcript_15853:128-1057(-)